MKKILALIMGTVFVFSAFSQEKAAEKKESPSVVAPAACGPCDSQEMSTYDYIVYNVTFYPLNRLMDFWDIITWDAGVGTENAAFVRVTNYMQFGGALGSSYFLANVTKKSYPSDPEELNKYLMNYLPYGAGRYSGWHYGFLCFSAENSAVTEAIGRVEKYEQASNFGIPSFRDDIYKENKRDFWAIETRLGSGFGLGIAIHPIEIADFVLGFFLLDINQDDL